MSDTQNLTAETWWNVNLAGREEELTRGATKLVRRCVRLYRWTESFAVRVLNGYRVFLESKKFVSDWHAEKLSPSLPIDRMWHAHILDTAHYASESELLVGQVVHHDPDGGRDPVARQARIQTMKNLLIARVGEDYDREVWYFGYDHVEEPRGLIRARSDDGLVAPPGSDVITVHVRYYDRDPVDVDFRIRRTTGMGILMEAVGQRMGMRPNQLRFILDGGRISDEDTPEELQMENGEQIEVYVEQTGC